LWVTSRGLEQRNASLCSAISPSIFPLMTFACIWSNTFSTVITILSAQWQGTVGSRPTFFTRTDIGQSTISVVEALLFTHGCCTIESCPTFSTFTLIWAYASTIVETATNDMVNALSPLFFPRTSRV